jgi:hypothetical protein
MVYFVERGAANDFVGELTSGSFASAGQDGFQLPGCAGLFTACGVFDAKQPPGSSFPSSLAIVFVFHPATEGQLSNFLDYLQLCCLRSAAIECCGVK